MVDESVEFEYSVLLMFLRLQFDYTVYILNMKTFFQLLCIHWLGTIASVDPQRYITTKNLTTTKS